MDGEVKSSYLLSQHSPFKYLFTFNLLLPIIYLPKIHAPIC